MTGDQAPEVHLYAGKCIISEFSMDERDFLLIEKLQRFLEDSVSRIEQNFMTSLSMLNIKATLCAVNFIQTLKTFLKVL